MTDYEFEAYKKGFGDGMFTIVSVFDIKVEDIGKKIKLNVLNSRVYELYQIWQNTIKDDKIEREDKILLKKVAERIDKFKKSLMHYIEVNND